MEETEPHAPPGGDAIYLDIQRALDHMAAAGWIASAQVHDGGKVLVEWSERGQQRLRDLWALCGELGADGLGARRGAATLWAARVLACMEFGPWEPSPRGGDSPG